MSATKKRRMRARSDAAAEQERPRTQAGTSEAGRRMLASVEQICGFERRLTGTDSERRAANHVAAKLGDAGREADVQPIHVHPQFGLVHALHCLLGFAGSLVAVVSAPAGFALALLAATSMYLDLNGRFYLLRQLFFRRASQNVVSPGSNPSAPATLVVVAHLDAARTGAFFDPAQMRRNERFARLLPFPFGPFRILFWAIAALLPLLGLRMAGIDSNVIAVLQLIPTLTLLLGIFALVDVELSEVVTGANDNASGVAVALELGAQTAAEAPEHLDLWVLLTGGEECLGEGMRAFVRSNRKRFEPASTYVLNLDAVGRGELRYVTSQGLAVSFDMDRRLIEICDALAEAEAVEEDGSADEDGQRRRALPLRHGFSDDAFAARIARLRAISLTALGPGGLVPPGYHTKDDVPAHVEPQALQRAAEFAADLIAAVDRDVARSLARESD